MHDEDVIDLLRDLAEAFGYAVRMEALGGPGGACVLAGKKMLFIDSTAPLEMQIETFAKTLVEEDLDSIYLLPVVRDTIERYGRPRTGP